MAVITLFVAVFCVGSNALKTADFNNLFDLALEAMTDILKEYAYIYTSRLRLWNVMDQNDGLSHSLGFKVTHISIVTLHSKDELEPLACPCPLPCQCHD